MTGLVRVIKLGSFRFPLEKYEKLSFQKVVRKFLTKLSWIFSELSWMFGDLVSELKLLASLLSSLLLVLLSSLLLLIGGTDIT